MNNKNIVWPANSKPQEVKLGHPGSPDLIHLDSSRPVAFDVHPDLAGRIVEMMARIRSRQILARSGHRVL